jgi:hypothetical protein
MRISKLLLAVAALMFLLLSSLLIGCARSTDPVSRSDIINYLEKELPEGKFTVINSPFVRTQANNDFNDIDYTTTSTWSAYFNDRPDLVFSAIYTEYTHYGAEDPTYVFSTTFNEVYTESYFAEFDLGNPAIVFNNIELSCTFANRQEMNEQLTQLDEFYQFVQSKKYVCAIPVSFHFEGAGIFSNFNANFEGLDPVFRTILTEETPEALLDAFARFALGYRIGLDMFLIQ